MAEERIEFRRFHHVTIAVADLDGAVADWTDRLGWSPAAVTATTATFPLDDAYVELVAADGADPGVTSVAVVVDDVDDAAERLRARGAAVSAGAHR